jgi:hypothetical protein
MNFPIFIRAESSPGAPFFQWTEIRADHATTLEDVTRRVCAELSLRPAQVTPFLLNWPPGAQ